MSDYDDLPVKERMKTFLFNEEMADVHFLVGSDAVKERIPGNKFLLATASEVFHGQLYGRFDVPDPIEVVDTTPETFKTVLLYIYTDEVDLTLENAFPLLYLAKKYMLNNLMAQVAEFIATAYSGQGIAKVLPHLHLVDDENAESIWGSIAMHADMALKSAEFLELSRDNVCYILQRDDLNVDEVTVFHSAVAWTKAECTRKDMPYAENARAVLGDALKLIRFPLMSIEAFTSGPAKSGFLSDQDQLKIYKWYGSAGSDGTMPFLTRPRRMHNAILSCNRFDGNPTFGIDGWFNKESHKRFFCFSVSARVLIHGVGILGTPSGTGSFEVNVSLLESESRVSLATKHAQSSSTAGSYQVRFDSPVLVTPGMQYKIAVDIEGPNSLYGKDGRHCVVCRAGSESVTFTFAPDTGLRKLTEYDVVNEGPIHEILFSF